MVDEKDSKKLKDILKSAAAGEQTDQAEMTAAVSKGMIIFMPFMTFIFSISIPSALSLYLLTSSVVGYFQQKRVLGKDVEEMNEITNSDVPAIAGSIANEAQFVGEISGAVLKKATNRKTKKKKKSSTNKKRRR